MLDVIIHQTRESVFHVAELKKIALSEVFGTKLVPDETFFRKFDVYSQTNH